MEISSEDMACAVVPLAAAVDIRNIGELAGRIKACIAGAAAVDVDAQAFVSGDVTLAQVLVAAGKTAEERGISFRVVNAGPDLAALLDRCGIDAARLGFIHRQQEG
jgi:anti-anti-sigma regulatory factor